MKMKKKIMAYLLVCTLMFQMSVIPVSAEETATSAADNNGWLYQQDFSCTLNDLISEGWNQNQIGGFSITTGGMLEANSGADSKYVFLTGNTAAMNWSNYTFEADVVMTSTTINDSYTSNGKWAGIFVGSQHATIKTENPNGYELRLFTTDDAGYQLCLTDQNNTGMEQVLSETISGVSAGDKCTLKLEVSGNYIKGYINDECLVEMEVSGIGNITGTIGLRAQGRISSFDNITVREAEINYNETFSGTTDDLISKGWNQNQLNGFNLTSDGMLEAKSGANSRYIFMTGNTEAMSWSNYTFEADVVMTSTTINDAYTSSGKWAGIFVGSQHATIKTENPNGYELRLFTTDDETYQLCLTDQNNTGMDQVSSKTISGVSAGDKCTLKLEVSGNYIKGYINDECLVEMEVSGIANITGTIGLRAQGRISSFDNITVREAEINYNETFSGTTDDLISKGWNQNQLNGFNLTSGGMLEAKSGANSRYIFMTGNTEAMSWSNYTFEADVVMTSTTINDAYTSSGKWAGIFVGSQHATIKTENPNGYELRLFTTDDETYQLYLTDQNNTGMDQVSSKTISGVSAGDKCTLKLEVSGNYIKGYINDECLVEMEVSGIANITGTIGLRAQGRVSGFDNISVQPTTKAANYFYDVSFYRNGVTDTKLQPYKEGYVFGGWYQDMAFKTPLGTEVTTGKAYAKFLDKNVLTVKAQLDATTLAASDTGTTKMRFVTTVDNLDYQKVGFTVSTPKKTADFESTTAYKNIVAKDSNTAISYSPSNFSSDSNYFITIILNNLSITEADLDKVFTVTPWWVTADGTTVTGATRDDITIQKGIETNLKNQSSTQ